MKSMIIDYQMNKDEIMELKVGHVYLIKNKHTNKTQILLVCFSHDKGIFVRFFESGYASGVSNDYIFLNFIIEEDITDKVNITWEIKR